MLGVQFGVARPVVRQLILRKDGLNRADRHARAAVDAGVGVDEELIGARVVRGVFLRMNTVDGAHLDAGGVFGSDAWLSDYVGHWPSLNVSSTSFLVEGGAKSVSRPDRADNRFVHEREPKAAKDSKVPNRPDDWNLKRKWIAQITHGLMTIHQFGITHGDLRCENVVLDEHLDARIIDVVQGQGIMEGWCPWKYPELESVYEPSWDMYCLGASIWELLTNGGTPPAYQELQFDFLLSDDEVALGMRGIAKRCLAEYPKERPTAEVILGELGGKGVCGCEASI